MDIKLRRKIFILLSLLLFTFILFSLTKLLTKKENTGTQIQKTEYEYTAEDLRILIPSEIDTILLNFGLKREWIKDNYYPLNIKDDGKKRNPTDKKPPLSDIPRENLWFNKEVLVPVDLPLVEVNFEINNFLRSVDFSSVAKEGLKQAGLYIDIYYSRDSSKKVLGKVNLIRSDAIKRDASSVCIILDNPEKFSAEELGVILKSPEKFSVIYPENISNISTQMKILESKRDFVIMFSLGGEDEALATFRTDMTPKEVTSKVKSLSNDYNKASGFILTDKIQDNNYSMFILSEFKKHTKKIFSESVIIKFETKETGKNRIYGLFTDIIRRTSKGQSRLIYLVDFDRDDFDNYVSEVYNMKKRGYSFVRFSEITKSGRDISE